MPIFDAQCTKCSWQAERYEHVRGVIPPCPECGATAEHYWKMGSFPNVIDDTINETIENLSATPQHFTSRSEKRIWLKSHGFQERVRHVGTPGEGSDKSPHTQRWY
jgi:hypothetical protein